MIAKITGGKDIKGVIMYNENKVARGEAEFIYAKDAMDHSINAKIHSFDPFLAMNKNTQKISFHVSLNLPQNINLSNDKFIEIGKEYMEKMGYGSVPYLMYKHEDKKHQHIHIVSCRVDETGKKINDSLEHVHSQKFTDYLTEKHNLPKVERTKSNENKTNNIDLQSTKSKMYLVVKHVQDKMKPTSMLEYNQLLKSFNLQASVQKGNLNNGKSYEGLNYMVDKNKESYSFYQEKAIIKSSSFNNIIQLKDLNALFEKNKDKKQALKTKTKSKLDKVLSKINVSTSLDITKSDGKIVSKFELQEELKKHKIDLVLHSNSSGISGVSFIDQETGCYFKGTEISKDLSVNNLLPILNNLEEPQPVIKPEQPVKGDNDQEAFIEESDYGFTQEVKASEMVNDDKADEQMMKKKRKRRRNL